MTARLPRIALFGFLLALAIVHAIIAFWTPIQGDDWVHWMWRGTHRDAGVVAWLGNHWTFSGAIGYVLARASSVHVILTPAVDVALVIGVFVLAMRRLPRSEWRDVLGVALVSALIWIAQPRAGLTWFHVSSVATSVYGTALAVWFVAPWRCSWQVPRVLWPALAIAGYCVGTSSRAIALATLVGIALAMRAMPRTRWMWIALGGLVVGVIAGFASQPAFELGAWSSLPIVQAGRLVTSIAVLVVLGLVSRSLAGDRPDPIEMSRWFAAWFAIALVCVLGPGDEARFLPATIALIIGGLPALLWLARARLPGALVVAGVVGVHAIVWVASLRTYDTLGGEARDRLAILERTKPGKIAVVPASSEIAPTSWCFGEDLGGAALRQQVAIEAFGMRDIVIVPPFRTLEPNPDIAVELVVDGAPQTIVDAARPPAQWATVPSLARRQFALFVARLRELAGEGVAARLVVRGHRFAELGSRPLLVAWYEHGELVAPHVTRSSAEDADRIAVDVRPFTEAWAVRDGRAAKLAYDDGRAAVETPIAGHYVIVACDAQRCLVADAFTPRF